MKRLGYTKFVAQGGDWGAIITELMGVQAPPELLGIHTNMANVIPLDIDKLAFSGAPAPANLSADEKLLRANVPQKSKTHFACFTSPFSDTIHLVVKRAFRQDPLPQTPQGGSCP
jgi:hypothetical protein